MRRFIAVFLLLAFCVSISQSLSAQTRPRRVVEPVNTPPPDEDMTQNDAGPPAQSRPPVLTGSTSSGKTNPGNQTGRDSSAPEEIGEGDTVRVETTLVTIPVSVTDRDGKYVPNLTREDFRVYENDIEQQVAYFAPVEKSFTVALVIDTSNSTRFRLEEIQDAAFAFVNQLRSDDQVMVVAFAENVRVLSEPTSDRNALRNAIKRVNNGGGTSLYDAVDYVINQRFSRIEGRKAIVLFTDGVDTTSRIATLQSNLHDAEEVDALIYPVQYNTYNEMNVAGQRRRSSSDSAVGILIDILVNGRVSSSSGSGGGGGMRGTTRADYDRADRFLGDLADRTGARRYRADDTQNLERSFAMVAEELRRQYGIGYYPQNPAQPGERRQFKVRVNRPNMIVRARGSYVAGGPNDSGNVQRVGK